MLLWSTQYGFMKLLTVNGVSIEAFGKLKMAYLERGFVKRLTLHEDVC